MCFVPYSVEDLLEMCEHVIDVFSDVGDVWSHMIIKLTILYPTSAPVSWCLFLPLFVIILFFSAPISMQIVQLLYRSCAGVLLVRLHFLWYHQCHRQNIWMWSYDPIAGGAVIVPKGVCHDILYKCAEEGWGEQTPPSISDWSVKPFSSRSLYQ